MSSAAKNTSYNDKYINNSRSLMITPVKLELKKNSHNKSVVMAEKGKIH
jgi:hypothetical protein